MLYVISQDLFITGLKTPSNPDGVTIVVGDQYSEYAHDELFCGILKTESDVKSTVRTNSTPIATGHGSVGGAGKTNAAQINIEIYDDTSDQLKLQKRYDLLRGMSFAGESGGVDLEWQEADGTYKILRNCQSVSLADITKNNQGAAKSTQWQLEALSPFIVSQPIKSTRQAAESEFTMTNVGNADSYPTFWIWGPCSEFTIINNTTDDALRVVYDLADGDHIKIDCRSKSVLHNSNPGDSAYGSVDHSNNDFMKVLSGPNSFSFSSEDSGDNTTIEYSYRDTWV